MNTTHSTCQKGGCACGYVRYQTTNEPIIVHCCHCRYCQKQTGSAFVINALFEATKVKLIAGKVIKINTPTPSGKGQTIIRCPKCHVAIWSDYFMGGLRSSICFIRVGTLDNPDLRAPDVHIFTESKQPWVNLSSEVNVFTKFYDYGKIWSKENYEWRNAMLAD